MYYNETINKKIPGCFVLVINKKENSYIKILQTFKSLLSLDKNDNLEIWIICSDFKKDLVNAIKKVFSNY